MESRSCDLTCGRVTCCAETAWRHAPAARHQRRPLGGARHPQSARRRAVHSLRAPHCGRTGVARATAMRHSRTELPHRTARRSRAVRCTLPVHRVTAATAVTVRRQVQLPAPAARITTCGTAVRLVRSAPEPTAPGNGAHSADARAPPCAPPPIRQESHGAWPGAPGPDVRPSAALAVPVRRQVQLLRAVPRATTGVTSRGHHRPRGSGQAECAE